MYIHTHTHIHLYKEYVIFIYTFKSVSKTHTVMIIVAKRVEHMRNRTSDTRLTSNVTFC